MDWSEKPSSSLQRLAAASANRSEMSASCPRKRRLVLLTWVTLEPKLWKIPANSAAMYPPPTTTTLSGSPSIRITVSEVCTCGKSIPGTSGRTALDPAATTTCSAVISAPDSVRSARGPVNLTWS